MAWTPQFANEELARMRAQREDRSSRATIRSKKRDDDFDTGRDSRTSDENYYQKLLRDIERRLRTGQPANKREVDLLIERGLLDLPEDYVLEGNRYVRMLMPEIRTKEQEKMGITPSMAPGGGVAFGSGFRGALTGDEAGILLSQRPTGPTAEQVSLVEGARGRIASRMREEDAIAAEQANLELERMRRLGTAERAKKTGETKAERNYRKWAEANPEQAIELELRQAQEARRAQELQMTMDKDEMKRQLRERIDAAVKSGNYSKEVIGKLNELKSRSFDPYSDVESIFAQAEGLIAVGDKKTADKLEAKAEEIKMSGEEWDRRRGVLDKERRDAEDRKAKRDAVTLANKNQYALQKDVDEANDDLVGANARLEGLESLAKSLGDAPENANRLQEVNEAIQVNEILVQTLTAERDAKQARLSQMSGFGGAEALPEGARGGGSQGQMDRAGFIEAFRREYGREPSSSEISKAQGRYWF